jgi:hypothetical protein
MMSVARDLIRFRDRSLQWEVLFVAGHQTLSIRQTSCTLGSASAVRPFELHSELFLIDAAAFLAFVMLSGMLEAH